MTRRPLGDCATIVSQPGERLLLRCRTAPRWAHEEITRLGGNVSPKTCQTDAVHAAEAITRLRKARLRT
jgi:hypothetical protein